MIYYHYLSLLSFLSTKVFKKCFPLSHRPRRPEWWPGRWAPAWLPHALWALRTLRRRREKTWENPEKHGGSPRKTGKKPGKTVKF